MNPVGTLRLGSGKGLAILVSVVLVCLVALLTHRLQWMAIAPLGLILYLCSGNPRLLYHLLLFSIPFSAEVDVTSTLGTDFPDEPLMWLLSALLIFEVLTGASFERGGLGRTGRLLATLLFLHLCWVGVSAALSFHPLLSAKFMAAKIWYAIALGFGTWHFLRSLEELRRAAAVLMTSTLIVMAAVTVKHAGLGFAFDAANLSVEPFFRNHVNYGAMLACLSPLPVAGLLLYRRRRGLFLAAAILWSVALFFSYSRGAWLAVAVGLATVMAMRYRVIWLLVAASVFALLSAFWYLGKDNRYLDFSPQYERTIYHTEFGEHLEATYRMKDISTMERFHRWIAAFRMAEGHLLHGYGPNSFYHEYRVHTVNAFRTYVSDNPEKSTVHNYFLLLLVEQGVPGMLLFLVLLLAMLHASVRWHRIAESREERVVAAVITAVLAAIVTLNMLSDLMESDKVGTLFFICAGLLVRFSDGETARSEPGRVRPAARPWRP